MVRRYPFGGSEYGQVLDLRRKVLREPLGLTFSANDIESERDEVLVANFEPQPTGCLNLRNLRDGVWKMRQVAVEPGVQGKGLGTKLVRYAESWLRARGARQIELNAREVVLPFYHRLGYREVGDRFEEVGIPHWKMVKDIVAPDGLFDIQRMFPPEFEARLHSRPLAILPMGATEWHGDHLPFGLDSLVAGCFCRELAERVGAVLFPILEIPITTLPHRMRVCYSTEAVKLVLSETLDCLAAMGFKAVLIVTGHYAQGHELELYALAQSHPRLKVLAASPLEVLEDDSLLDHAGRWEAACFRWFHPDKDRIGALPDQVVPRRHAVLGEHPKLADPDEGWDRMDSAMQAWARWAERLLAGEQASGFYERRRQAYQAYRDVYYKGNWEQALQEWWSTK